MKTLKSFATILLLLLGICAVVCPVFTDGECASLVALAQLDKPYVFNTEGPDKFDCSGLVLYSYQTLGVEIEHWARGISEDDQYPSFDKIEQGHIGDLIFLDTVPNNSNPADHVGILIGGNRFVHASSSGKRVMISTIDDSWRERFIGGKRIAAFPVSLESIKTIFSDR